MTEKTNDRPEDDERDSAEETEAEARPRPGEP